MVSNKVRLTHGMKQLLDDDPCSFLLYAVEQVQDQAHHRRLGRVLKRLQRRKEELGWVHVSDLQQECERAIAARLLGVEFPREKLDPKKSRIFENGTYTHLRYYNYFLSLPPPFNVRIAAVLKFWPVIGEADVIVEHPELGTQIIELKTMNTDQFGKLLEPLSQHKSQLNGYIALYGKEAQGQVWYENKNNQEIKTFSYTYDEELFKDSYGRILKVAQEVLAGKLPPACGFCSMDSRVGDLENMEERLGYLARVIQREAIGS